LHVPGVKIGSLAFLLPSAVLGGRSWHFGPVASINNEAATGAVHTPSWKIETDPMQLLPVGTPHEQDEQVSIFTEPS
jgi:hypothetical protein